MSDKFEGWKNRSEKHDLNHTTVIRNGQKDISCTRCNEPQESGEKFQGFWKWYKEVIPEVETYSRITQQNFLEWLEDFEKPWKSLTSTEKAKINNKINRIISSMRYRESPKMTCNELRTLLMEMIIVSSSFEEISEVMKSDVYESMSEGSMSEMDDDKNVWKWFETQTEVIKRHFIDCNNGQKSMTKDNSCRNCYEIKEEVNDQFKEFWEWCKERLKASTYSQKTLSKFKKALIMEEKRAKSLNEYQGITGETQVKYNIRKRIHGGYNL